MKLNWFLTSSLIFIVSFLQAQSVEDEVLFTVDDAPVYTSEFKRVYSKNLDLVQDESQKDIDEYLKLFTSYKLKLKEAHELRYHEKKSYLRELENYRKQLAKNYITDSKVTDALVREAYERISNDVKANHILIKVPENASPNDTLTAYNKLMGLRKRALEEGFEKVRKEVHNGKTVYGEELGYFSGFKMVYKFENAAYSTKAGDISMPFRTRFGYHIVKVLDKRKSEGSREVAHIMVRKNEKDSLGEELETRIHEIYKKLNQGEAFEALAKQFSDDKNSSPKGGILPSLSRGQISAKEFEDVAFSLDTVGQVSKPFKTDFGWHIVKLYKTKPIPGFEAMKPELIGKVKRDSRSKLIDEALIEKLKTKYEVTHPQSALTYFESILTDDYFKNTWKLPVDFNADQTLLRIENTVVPYKDFGNYLLKTQRSTRSNEALKSLVSKKYEAFLRERLIKYQEDNLENENEEFAHIVAEYRDGLLLFELMENTIWNTAKTDSLEIQKYYEKHKENYVLPQRVDVVVASSAKQKVLKKVTKLLQEGVELNQIKSLINGKDNIDVIFTVGIMDATHQSLPKNFNFKKGISNIQKHNGAYQLVQVKAVLPKTQKTFEDAKGTVVSDYQTYKEEKWVEKLAEKYKIVINDEVFEKVKTQLK
ncbi:peptidylprolyl isomerase [Tamlana sp. 2201CG12-4]|uniref:peptidylprolyl isomerase n=1 Tax=Tamlana sp. 2201CG12-4 TaxID=3112582 RepID=UPI002DBE2DEB|nr:peptidylprolyl isomerase [Tamlana sp. 2201CG12-4]MEC3907431.1 peptidylprolyl isomerase [Tamlana sp. 2201CG12-4]